MINTAITLVRGREAPEVLEPQARACTLLAPILAMPLMCYIANGFMLGQDNLNSRLKYFLGHHHLFLHCVLMGFKMTEV